MAKLAPPPITLVSRINVSSMSVVGTYVDPKPFSIYNGAPYDFQVTFTITPQSTSYEDSVPTPFEYNGFNIRVGDWIGQNTGFS